MAQHFHENMPDSVTRNPANLICAWAAGGGDSASFRLLDKSPCKSEIKPVCGDI